VPTTRSASSAKIAPDLAEAMRSYADASLKEAQALATATLAFSETSAEAFVEQSRQLATTWTTSALATAWRGQQLSVETWKTLTDTAIGGLGNASFGGWRDANLKEAFTAGIDLAKGVLDTQRELGERLVAVVAPGS
jgi:hypothetical protein